MPVAGSRPTTRSTTSRRSSSATAWPSPWSDSEPHAGFSPSAPGLPIDERHLTGLPGIRAVLHDYVIDEPLRSSRYPEPDYEDLGRARILHVFKDRGEDEEQVVRPTSFDHIAGPRAPVGVV